MNHKMKYKTIYALLLIVAISILLSACGGSDLNPSQKAAEQVAIERDVHVPENDVEFDNYNRRQQLADDPTTIMWCTSAFPIPSSPLFTVPIVGKLTSGNKRPFPTTLGSGRAEEYIPELPGPDGMYGSSGEYRYGFTPNNVYADWYNMSLFCTTEPTVWQRETTTIVMETDPELMAAHEAARLALAAGKTDEASNILEKAIGKLQGR